VVLRGRRVVFWTFCLTGFWKHLATQPLTVAKTTFMALHTLLHAPVSWMMTELSFWPRKPHCEALKQTKIAMLDWRYV
jgi:hypothetical protein